VTNSLDSDVNQDQRSHLQDVSPSRIPSRRVADALSGRSRESRVHPILYQGNLAAWLISVTTFGDRRLIALLYVFAALSCFRF
jgi:hypothetical protein